MSRQTASLDLVHDIKIVAIQHALESPQVTFVLDRDKRLVFKNVVLFLSESYFGPQGLSADGLYIAQSDTWRQSWLIEQARAQRRPGGQKKWGDSDDAQFHLRPDDLLHVNLFCNDWEFDVVCESYELL